MELDRSMGEYDPLTEKSHNYPRSSTVEFMKKLYPNNIEYTEAL